MKKTDLISIKKKKDKLNMLNVLDIIKVLFFIIIIFLFGILTVLNFKNNDRLELELRDRTKLKKPTKKSILNNEVQLNLEKFYNDRFKFREELLTGKIFIDLKILKKPKISDIAVIYDKNKLFKFRTNANKFDIERFDRTFKKWEETKKYLDKEKIPLIVVTIPDQSHMFFDQYSDYLYNEEIRYKESKEYLFKNLKRVGIDFIDAEKMFEKDREKNFFKTDHHLSFQGTLKIYDELIRIINKKYFKIENLRNKQRYLETKEKFIGSHNRKLAGLFPEDTKLEYVEPRKPIKFKRYEDGILQKEAIINDFDNAKYHDFYMSGNNAYSEIKTNRKDKPNILIVGDSTNNQLESIMWQNANNLNCLDFRYYKGGSLINFMKKMPKDEKPDIVIVHIISGYYHFLERVIK